MISLETHDNARKATAISFQWGILFFSYETLIAFMDLTTYKGYRVKNSWGPTTGKHINAMGVSEYTIVDPTYLQKVIRKSNITYSLRHMNKRINKNAKS